LPRLAPWAIALALWLASPIAAACSCRYDLDAHAARAQQHVFAFRLLASRRVPGRYLNVGEIEVVDAVRGEPSRFRSVRSSRNTCCSLRLTPGRYYVAFTSQAGPVLFLHQGNVLAAPPHAYDRPDGRFARAIRGMLAGGDPGADWWERADVPGDIPPPPPPNRR
jgi:hypothetical protein